MKICVFGNKTLTSELLMHLHANGFPIDTLIKVRNADKYQKTISGFSTELDKHAQDLGIKVHEVHNYKLTSKEDLDFFSDEKFDIGISLGWQRLIPGLVLASTGKGVFGWHGSGFRFPNGRGRSPLNWTIRLGLDKIYHNLFQYSEGVDDGLVYSTNVIPILPGDYISDLQVRVLKSIKSTCVELLTDAESNKVKLFKQPDLPYVTFPKLDEKSGWIQVKLLNCDTALNIIRSCSHPFPGAYVKCETGNLKIRIWKAVKCELESFECDDKNFIVKDNEMYLKFVDGMLRLESYEIEGRGDLVHGVGVE